MTTQDFMNQLLAHMGCEDATLEIEDTDGEVRITLKVQEEDSGMLIGRRGETLDAMRKMASLALREQLGEKRLRLDVNGYRERRGEVVNNIAQDALEQVAEFGHPVTLPYLNSEERKTVHTFLADKDVDTASDGVGMDRRLTVYPKGYLNKAEAAPSEVQAVSAEE